MKKILFILIAIVFNISLFAQTGERIEISGKVQMPPGDEIQGISIFNLSSNRGTVTDNEGEFQLAVAINDSISVSSIQFQEFIILIDQGVIDSRELNISVNEVVNQLPEVVVSPYDLTGNVRVDIARLPVAGVPDTLTAAEVNNTYFPADAEPEYQDPPRNYALAASENRLVNGINFVNLFKQLLITRKAAEVQRQEVEIDNKVRALYDDEFFRENLGIKLENINDFIFYADDNGLSEEMLQEENELDLIQFLVEQSKKYKKERSRN